MSLLYLMKVKLQVLINIFKQMRDKFNPTTWGEKGTKEDMEAIIGKICDKHNKKGIISLAEIFYDTENRELVY